MDMTTPTRTAVLEKLALLTRRLPDDLYMDDAAFMENMKSCNLGCDDIERYKCWEWPQGIGLFCLWKLFNKGENPAYLDLLKSFFDRQLQIGLPTLNVNTLSPMLALSFLAEYTREERYLAPCRQSAAWMLEHFPRTQQGGFQHTTSDAVNREELWTDTVFMSVLFLANMGRILNDERYKQEAEYQFLLHVKYLLSNETGLFYHGWTFDGNHNFTRALWARGNCWLTIAIPEYLAISSCDAAVRRFLASTLNRQVDALLACQDETGMWHTLLNDPTSYLEASATAGFGYGILLAAEAGLIPAEQKRLAQRALAPILESIDERGVVNRVSYGTSMGRTSLDFYKTIEFCPMLYGQALATLFLHAFLQQEEAWNRTTD
jgi:unsaturated rhamnogalacturonyl hydrolase